jgi:hypothetical protein
MIPCRKKGIVRIINPETCDTLGTAFICKDRRTICTVPHVLRGWSRSLVFGQDCDGNPIKLHRKVSQFSDRLLLLESDCEYDPLSLTASPASPGDNLFIQGYPQMPASLGEQDRVTVRLCRTSLMANVTVNSRPMLELQGSQPKGFSGAPVMCCSSGSVIGVLDSVGISYIDSNKEIGFCVGLAIPVSELISNP